MIPDDDELLYTQADIDEWMRTCQNLQDHIREQEEIIENLQKQLAVRDKMLELEAEHFIFYRNEGERNIELKKRFVRLEKEAKEAIDDNKRTT